MVSKEPLSLHVTQNSSIDIRKGVSSILVVKVAEAVKAKVELKDMYTLDTDGRTYTFNDKLGKATIDFSAVK